MVTSNAAEDLFFKALADSTRRDILTALAGEGMPVHALAERFSITRPAISRHLRILKQAELVQSREIGRENVYYLKSSSLRMLEDWLNQFWMQRFDQLRILAEGLSDD